MPRVRIGDREHDIEVLRAWFPREREQPEDGRFEVGLVLAGAISAGAYTAGVMDFLIEALDAWSLAKSREEAPGDRTVPPHEVILKVITGASAGGMNGAIAAAALNYGFPPVYPAEKLGRLPEAERSQALEAESGAEGNPFYDAWVKGIDIRYFLGTKDLETQLQSFLDCSRLDAIAGRTVAFRGRKLDAQERPRRRRWVENPLTVMLTVGNLRGVPYGIDFEGATQLGHEMTMHRDHVTFAVTDLSDRPRPPHFPPPHVIELVRPNSTEGGWGDLASAALATGAFPLFLRARPLRRNGAHYNYRGLSVTPPPEDAVSISLPRWPDGVTPPDYHYLCVDGGVMNNEPFDLARTFLAGTFGRNPRKGTEAKRAVILVDPFSDRGSPGPEEARPLHRVAGALFGAWKAQARFKEEDLALANDEHTYSRFLVAPSRGGGDRQGAEAIASGALEGFMGFMSEHYRRHDYLLGRRNCQRFLENHFTLPPESRLFANWPEALKRQVREDRSRRGLDDTHLPIVPLVGRCQEAEPLPAWPRGRFQASEVAGGVERRVDALYRSVVDSLVKAIDQGSEGSRHAPGWLERTLRPLKTAALRVYIGVGWRVARPLLLKMIQDKLAAGVERIDRAN